MRHALEFREGDFVVGAVARLDPRKGLDTLIDALGLALERRPELRLLLIGDGPERSRLDARSSALGIRSRVLMVHHQARVRSYLAAMDLFAAPSRTEGLGLAVIEALAAGLPVVASRVGGIPEIVDDGVCGRLLPPDRPEVWADALIDLAGSRDTLERWSAASPGVARRFSIEASGEALQREYERVLGDEFDRESRVRGHPRSRAAAAA